MNRGLKDKLIAVIGRLLRFERPGRGTQFLQGGPMNNESILAVKDPNAALVCGKSSAAEAPLEAVGRSLGYTRKELDLAGDVLTRFVWRYPAEPSRENMNSTDAEEIDSISDRDHAA
jgi:hypothetical protein